VTQSTKCLAMEVMSSGALRLFARTASDNLAQRAVRYGAAGQFGRVVTAQLRGVGAPRPAATRSSMPIRCSPAMLRSPNPTRHSRVCSSKMDTRLIGRPLVVAWNWQSTGHARLAYR
jgi:hypothetical protein